MNCCNKKEEQKKGLLRGILYGLAPHTFCIAFIVFTILGTTTATALLKPLLLNPYFFYILVTLSFIFATISTAIYLKRNSILSFQGIKRKWKYLSILYGTTISVNLIFFMVIFPALSNLNLNLIQPAATTNNVQLASITLEVSIPCPGHAPLITGELKENNGIKDVKFRFPNLFDIKYDPQETSEEKLTSLEIFNTYKATIVK